MYYNTLRVIFINGGSLTFVNSSHHWLVIKRCLSMFDDKSYIRMARLVPEWLSEWDKKTPDLVLAIRAVILGFLYTSSVRWPYIQIIIRTWAYICRHICIGQHSNVEEFLNYVRVIRLFYVLNMGMPNLNNYDQRGYIMIQIIVRLMQVTTPLHLHPITV